MNPSSHALCTGHMCGPYPGQPDGAPITGPYASLMLLRLCYVGSPGDEDVQHIMVVLEEELQPDELAPGQGYKLTVGRGASNFDSAVASTLYEQQDGKALYLICPMHVCCRGPCMSAILNSALFVLYIYDTFLQGLDTDTPELELACGSRWKGRYEELMGTTLFFQLGNGEMRHSSSSSSAAATSAAAAATASASASAAAAGGRGRASAAGGAPATKCTGQTELCIKFRRSGGAKRAAGGEAGGRPSRQQQRRRQEGEQP